VLSLLLDTHILIWWRSDPQRLSKPQSAALSSLERSRLPAAISAITLWEVAKMIERGRAEITVPLEDWLAEIESHPLLTVVPLSAKIVAESVRLGDDFHRDPADQIIVATARCHGLKLLTADERIRRWGKVPLI
jgi:PIN domain nuclease of toxin-antitoxin system